MLPTDQDPGDLSLVVAGAGRLGAVNLTILRQATLSWQDCQITFNVLCESHEVIVRRDGRIALHELLSCAEVADDGSYLHRHAFGDGSGHSFRGEGYAVDVTVGDLPPGGVVPLNPDLYVAFPNAVGGETTPFTSIQWDARPDRLIWRTIHLYALPGRTVGVFSTSRLTCAVGRVAPLADSLLVAR